MYDDASGERSEAIETAPRLDGALAALYAAAMRFYFRSLLALCAVLAGLSASACTRWRAQTPHDVAGLADPKASFAVVLDTLKAQQYRVLEQDASSLSVLVRAHVDESIADRVSTIRVHVAGREVHLTGGGYLVRPNGSIHQALGSELTSLQKLLRKNLAAGGAPALAPVPSVAAPSTASPPPSGLPVAWSEPAYDPKVWGNGNFTCLPVKLSEEDGTQLMLKLSNGETADVLLSLAHAPELCRSPAACKLPGGCPALGIADQERVSRLAGRLSKHEIGSLATLYARGKAVAVIDLGKHGSIAQAIADKK